MADGLSAYLQLEEENERKSETETNEMGGEIRTGIGASTTSFPFALPPLKRRAEETAANMVSKRQRLADGRPLYLELERESERKSETENNEMGGEIGTGACTTSSPTAIFSPCCSTFAVSPRYLPPFTSSRFYRLLSSN